MIYVFLINHLIQNIIFKGTYTYQYKTILGIILHVVILIIYKYLRF